MQCYQICSKYYLLCQIVLYKLFLNYTDADPVMPLATKDYDKELAGLGPILEPIVTSFGVLDLL